jgi:hypothetical protein
MKDERRKKKDEESALLREEQCHTEFIEVVFPVNFVCAPLP